MAQPNQGEYLTQLPTVTAADPSDIIYAVQGYSSPSSPGISVQETIGQIIALASTTFTLYSAGNPNGQVGGNIYQYCWDTVNSILYICIKEGTASTAVWNKVITLTGGSGITISQSGEVIEISASASQMTWNNITTDVTVDMQTNNAYQANSADLVTLALPIASSFGDALWISGYGSGGWIVEQAANQQIIIGDAATTLGVDGSLASSNQYDGVELYCVVPNLIWKNVSGPQGCLTIV